MRFKICFLLALLIGTFGQRAGHGHCPLIPCDVTVSNGEHLRQWGVVRLAGVARWNCDVQTGRAGFVFPDGSLAMKFGWERGVRVRSRLTATG
jgi:hypothetical protein